MSRLPFDPAKMARARQASREEAVQTAEAALTVSQLAARIDTALKTGFPAAVRFVGEVSGFRDRTHWYFDLKDAGAVVNCVMFQSAARKMPFTPQNGQQVLARGRVEFYSPGGKVSILLDKIEAVGAGALELAYRALCEELRGLGWFAPERKRPIPAFPRRIAVVTSRTGAALQDVLVTMRKRCPAVGVLVVDCRVQGAAAAPEVAQAIRYLSDHAGGLGIDAILVTRGGGSMEDLWAFNDRAVAQAIVTCAVPVVAAIGHETDTTIAELAADERCATPTQAAMRLTPDRVALSRQTDSILGRLRLLIERHAAIDRRRLASAAGRPIFVSPARVLDGPRDGLDSLARRLASGEARRALLARSAMERLATRLERHRPAAVHGRLLARLSAAGASLQAAGRRLADHSPINSITVSLTRGAATAIRAKRTTVEALERQLIAVGPLQVLERGYSVTLTAGGGVVRSPSDAGPGAKLITRLAEGTIDSVVSGGTTDRVVRATRLTRKKRPLADGAPGLWPDAPSGE